jgi:hypothetical protein
MDVLCYMVGFMQIATAMDFGATCKLGQQLIETCKRKRVYTHVLRQRISQILRPRDLDTSFWEAFAKGSYQMRISNLFLLSDIRMVTATPNCESSISQWIWDCFYRGIGHAAQYSSYNGSFVTDWTCVSFRMVLNNSARYPSDYYDGKTFLYDVTVVPAIQVFM